MCGILGIVAPHGDALDIAPGELRRMRDTMAARGPDGAGTFLRRNVAFAHRRLAIRDLPGGDQPWLSEEGQCVLVFNGEIYNDAELRNELRSLGHRFRSRGDTEVVLEAWRAWGPACVEKFRGMFAFGLYDFTAESLFLARDRFGVKPLFLSLVDGQLAFASTVRALLAHPRQTKSPNWPALSHYLSTFRLTLGRETVFKDIQQLLPAERLLWTRDGAVRIERYWDYPPCEEDIGQNEARERINSLLRDAVRSQLVSDVPVGMFLSGGVDSSTIAAMVRDCQPARMIGKCGGGTNGVLAASASTSDFAFARRCADHVEFDYGEVRVDAEDYAAGWNELLDVYATPVSTPTDVILFRLAREMKKSVGVVLGGEGADELFCGYSIPHSVGRDFELAQLLKHGSLHGAAAAMCQASLQRSYGRVEFASEVDQFLAASSLIPSAVKPHLLSAEAWELAEHDARMVSRYSALLNETPQSPLPRRHQTLLHRVNLEALLARLDTATMSAGLEGRVPFTDHHLVEAGFRLPHTLRIDISPHEQARHLAARDLEQRGSLRSKRILRMVARQLLPTDLATRRKESFPTPVSAWLAGPWRHQVRRQLLESPFAREHFHPAALQEMAAAPHCAGMWLWPLLNVIQWGDRQFGTAGMVPVMSTAQIHSRVNEAVA